MFHTLKRSLLIFVPFRKTEWRTTNLRFVTMILSAHGLPYHNNSAHQTCTGPRVDRILFLHVSAVIYGDHDSSMIMPDHIHRKPWVFIAVSAKPKLPGSVFSFHSFHGRRGSRWTLLEVRWWMMEIKLLNAAWTKYALYCFIMFYIISYYSKSFWLIDFIWFYIINQSASGWLNLVMSHESYIWPPLDWTTTGVAPPKLCFGLFHCCLKRYVARRQLVSAEYVGPLGKSLVFWGKWCNKK